MENFRDRFSRKHRNDHHVQRDAARTSQRPCYQYDRKRAYEENQRYSQPRYEEPSRYSGPVYEEAFYNDAQRYNEPYMESYNEPYNEPADEASDVSERLEEIEARLSEYASMLRAIKESCDDNSQVSKALEKLEDSQASIKAAIDNIKENNVEKVVENALDENRNIILNAMEANKNDTIDQISDIVETQKEEYKELVHYENVKVYRNVQAVVVDEAGKTTEKISGMEKSVSKKINIAITFSIIAMAAAVLNLAFNILTKFGAF